MSPAIQAGAIQASETPSLEGVSVAVLGVVPWITEQANPVPGTESAIWWKGILQIADAALTGAITLDLYGEFKEHFTSCIGYFFHDSTENLLKCIGSIKEHDRSNLSLCRS